MMDSNSETSSVGGALSQAVKTLIQRLIEKPYPVEHVREAADALVQMQTHALSLRLSEMLIQQEKPQIRLFGRMILASLAPVSPEAAKRLVSIGPIDGENHSLGANLQATTPTPEAMADLIRAWLSEEKHSRPKTAEDWLPQRPH
jgi:hypothetical protein